MSLFNILKSIEAYEDLSFDAELIAEYSQRFNHLSYSELPPIRFHLPTFKHYQSEELCCSGANEWPSISITGGACKLQCDHCKAKILEPMIPVTDSYALQGEVNRLIGLGAKGVLLSGGSNHRNEVDYSAFLPMIRKIKDEHPEFQIAVHTALVDKTTALAMEQSGIDVAMFDVIGAQDTIRQVYHLRREVGDFEETLAALSATSMRVVPHIVIGLHYGRLLGEWRALEMLTDHRIDALVLVVVMPHYADVRRPFVQPDPVQVGSFFLDARKALQDIPLILGCARPAGRVKSIIDAYAVMAGLDGIAHPADGAVTLASRLGRGYQVSHSCCSISTADPVSGLSQLGQVLSDTPLVAGRQENDEQPIRWMR